MQLIKVFIVILLSFVLINCGNSNQKIKVKKISITTKDIIVNGKTVEKFLFNGSDKAPIIKARKGENLKVTFKNNTTQNTVIHWHGVFLENDQDGVADITQPAIKPGESYTYTFDVEQTGTKWYHSHFMNEDAGLFGALIFEGDEDIIKADKEYIAQMSGQLDKTPEKMIEKLQKHFSSNSTATSMKNMDNHQMHGMNHDMKNMDHSKHGSMDMSNMHHKDGKAHMPIDYSYMMLNGKNENDVVSLRVGKKLRVRFINSFAAGEVEIFFAGNMDLVASDGNFIQPIKTNAFSMSPGETYDAIVSIDATNLSYEMLLKHKETGLTKKIIIGSKKAKPIVANHQVKVLFAEGDYSQMLSLIETTDNDKIEKTIDISLYQKANSYDWVMESKDIQDGVIKLKKGEKVRVNFSSLMNSEAHPFHLHGMDFKLINGSNDYAPMKNTFLLPAMKDNVVSIEITPDALGKWAFHCHNLYHMAGGMMSIIEVVE